MMWRKSDVVTKSQINGLEQKTFSSSQYHSSQQDPKTKAFEWLITKSQLSAPELQHCVLYLSPITNPLIEPLNDRSNELSLK